MRDEHHTFQDYLKRDLQLFARHMKIKMQWHMLQQFNPWKSVFYYFKFKRVLGLIQDLRIVNNKKGYWGF
jgi:hypothetical protein